MEKEKTGERADEEREGEKMGRVKVGGLTDGQRERERERVGRRTQNGRSGVWKALG